MNESMAYRAMFAFLEERYKRLPSDDLGGFLGDLALQPDGEPSDLAVIAEWDHAIAHSAGTTAENIVAVRRKAS